MKKEINDFLEYVGSFLPTKIPNGLNEFNAWSASIIKLSKLPNNDSTNFAVAVMVTHLGPTEARKPKRYFINALNKGAATQVAYAVMQQLKSKQEAELKEREKAQETSDPVSQGQKVSQT